MHPARWVILLTMMLFFAAACDEDGLAGKNSLVKLSEEPAGGACPQGGTKVESGLDLDGDGELDLDEVRNVQYFCRDAGCTITDNGDGTKTIACSGDSSVTVKDGADGAGCAMTDNEDGTYTITCDGVSVIVSDASGDNAHKTLIVIEEAPEGTCPNGGQKVTIGIDRDDDGTLDESEVTSTRYLCNGANGHDSLTTIDPLAPGETCPAGGHMIRNGVDTDDDGTLDAGEVVSEVAVCDGADGNGAMTEVSPLDPGEGGCAAGGYLFRTGVDANGNGALDEGEYDEVAVCHGEKGDPGEDGVCAGNHPPVIVSIDVPEPDGLQEDTYRLDIPYTVTVNADDEDGDALSYEAIGGYASIAAGAEPNQIVVTPRALGGPFSFAVIVSDGCQVTMGDFVIGEVWDETTPPFIDDHDIWFEDITGTSVSVRWEKAWDDWSAIQDLEYKVVYALDPEEIDDIDLIELGGGTIAMDWTVDVDTAPIAGLTEGQQYYATVLVRDEYHNMAQYDIAPFTMPDVTAPTTGGDIAFSDIAETSFTVSWDGASDNLSDLSTIEYKVVYSTDPEEIDTEQEVQDLMGDGVLVSWEAEVYSYEMIGMLDGMVYYVNVLVRDAAGNTVLYGVESVMTPDTTPPDDISGLYAVGLNGRVCFRWDDLGDHSLDHYEVTWTPNAPAEPMSIPADAFFRCIDGLTNDTEYTFSIVAIDRGNNESANPTTVTTTPADPGMGYAINGSINSSSNPAETKLYRFDPSTAKTTLIGATDVWNANGLAVNPDDDSLYLFATNWDYSIPSLYTLDPLTGEATWVGDLDPGNFSWTSDLAFSADGTLYGWGRNYNGAFVIDLKTAQGAFLGDSGVTGNTAGIAFTPGGNLIMKSSNTLNTIDLATGAGTYLADIDVQYFEDETGWGWDTLRNVLEISDTGIGFSVVRTNSSSYLYAFNFDDMVAIPVGDLKVAGISAVELEHTFKPIDQKFSGIKRFVPEKQLDAWTVCHTDTYTYDDDGGTPFADIQTACKGANLMIACRPVGSSLFTLAAWAPRDDAIYDTGTDTTTTHDANGVAWYFNDNMSWGFAPEGAGVNKDSCDYDDSVLPNQDVRLCWHVWSETLRGGYRCGAENTDSGMTGGNDQWERVILHADF